MLDPAEAMTEQALEQGRRNEQAIILIKKHCAHARVERSRHMGHSMLEDMTGLPISGREMRCQYGRTLTTVATDLLRNAVAFFEENCIGCPHRELQGIPNLKMVAEDMIAERDEARERRVQAEEHARAARAGRARERAQRIASEPAATRALIALLDGIDAEQPDERGDELVDLCRLNPDLCTARAADVLLDTAAEIADDRLFAALRYLDAGRRVDRDRLLGAALDALARRPLGQAASLVVALGDGLAPGQLEPALESIVALAAPLHDFGYAPTPELAPLHLAAARELPALLDVLRSLLADENKYGRRLGGAGAERLIEHAPTVAQVLVAPLLDALEVPGSLDRYMGDPRDDLVDALAAALRADPDGTAAAIERRGVSAPPPVRDALFSAYEAMIREGRRRDGEDKAAAELALDAAFRHISGDWGEEVSRSAADLVEMAARWEPHIMAQRVDTLFGALLTMLATPPNSETVLEVPAAMPPLMRAMQAHHDDMMRGFTIDKLREALGHLVPIAPEAVARNVFSVIDAPEVDSDEARELRDEAVRLLGDLGRRADLLPDVLPALWTALMHADQSVRANAIRAWQEIASVPNRRLPPDLDELLPVLLADPYVIVHKAAARALDHGLPIPENLRSRIVPMLLIIANEYKSKDDALLDGILRVVWRQATFFPAETRDGLRERCLQLAEHLAGYTKERFVTSRRQDAVGLPSYILRLIEVTERRDRAGSGTRDDQPLRMLRDVPVAQLAPHLDRISHAARQHLPHDPWTAQRFVEILQRCGAWMDAATLAGEVLATLPNDTEHAIQRDGLLRLDALCRMLAAMAGGSLGDARVALADARAADVRQAAATSTQRFPWELDG